MKYTIDFMNLESTLGFASKRLLTALLPIGKFEGKEYVALNPTRCDRNLGSFRINHQTLVWCDFASGDKGKGFISLYGYLHNLKSVDAAIELCRKFDVITAERFDNVKYQSAATSNSTSNSISKSNADKDHAISKLIQGMWLSSIIADNTVVELYLRSRGITGIIPDTIRYLPDCFHKSTNSYLPCMLGAITKWPQGGVIALHRTYLKENGIGKANLEQPKMILGKSLGGAIRLLPVAKELIIAEGLETALSLYFTAKSRKSSLWAILSASSYKNLILPDKPFASKIVIAADNDDAGIKAAELAAVKWQVQGREVKIAYPPSSKDFNDILNSINTIHTNNGRII